VDALGTTLFIALVGFFSAFNIYYIY
jgi:hypothetical protein